MRLAEGEGFEGVGWGLTDLIRLWKLEEKSKAPRIRTIRGAPGRPLDRLVSGR